MPFPIAYPSDAFGPGRLVEIASFQKSDIPVAEYAGVFDSCMKTVSTYPISRKGIFGSMLHDPKMQVMLMDWTSAAAKDEFEPGQQYQSLKPVFAKLIDPVDAKFACHHIILPGQAETPEVGGYLISFATAPTKTHDQLASVMEKYFDSAPQGGSLVFAAAAPSRENAETVASVAGWRTLADAEAASKSPEFAALQAEFKQLGAECSHYVTDLSKPAL